LRGLRHASFEGDHARATPLAGNCLWLRRSIGARYRRLALRKRQETPFSGGLRRLAVAEKGESVVK